MISANGRSWFLVNATPEIRGQLESFPTLHPRAPRECPVDGIILTNGDLDHCLGLLSLRESQPLTVYATARVRDGFTKNNVLYRTLERFPGQVNWRELPLEQRCSLSARDGGESGLSIEAVPMPGKLPIHLEKDHGSVREDNVALLIREEATGRTVAYAPAVAGPSTALDRLAEADCLFFDGTFWSDDELGGQGLGKKKAKDMAHWPVGGPEGSLSFLESRRKGRRILIHVNNTNPILLEDSPEAERVRAAGVTVAYDGMEVEL